MPLYEYVCTHCAHEFEELSAVTHRDRRRTCPSCSQKAVDRKISTFSPHQGAGHQHSGSAPDCGSCPEPGMCGMDASGMGMGGMGMGGCGMGGCC